MVYEYLDHISDIYIHVSSGNLEGLFQDAAAATCGVMFDTASVKQKRSISVELEADDLEQLLYKWVDRLIYHFDADGFALSSAEVCSVRLEAGGAASVSAELHGDDYNPESHGHGTGVKAMTYSLMRIFQKDQRWESYFVLDI